MELGISDLPNLEKIRQGKELGVCVWVREMTVLGRAARERYREGEGMNHAHSGKTASAKEEILRTLLAFGGDELYLE